MSSNPSDQQSHEAKLSSKYKKCHTLAVPLLIDLVRAEASYKGVVDDKIVAEFERELSSAAGIPSIFLVAPSRHFNRNAVVRRYVKSIRARLRRVVGAFEDGGDIPPVVVDTAMRALRGHQSMDELRESLLPLVTYHVSTHERKESIVPFAHALESLHPKRATIISLGSGIDPLLVFWWNELPASLHAYDLSARVIDVLKTLWKHTKQIVGDASVLDLNCRIPTGTYDVAWALKVFDLLPHARVEQLMASGLAPRWLVSFSSLTLTGKTMRQPRRAWFAKMCRRKGWTYTITEFPGELLYVVNTS